MSQNFLVARSTVERIAEAAKAPLVVELGPGVGTLTGELLRQGCRVVAVEQDRDMLSILGAEFGHVPRLGLEHGDAASFDFKAVAQAQGAPVNVAGNLPYAVTGAILRHLTHHRKGIRRAVLMVQKEVRDRLIAEPGTKAHGALTIFVSASFRVSPLFTVSKGSFFPAPKVTSAVVALDALEPPRAVETTAFRTVVRAAFDARRKTLRNALMLAEGGDPIRVDRALREASLDPDRRGETLSVEEFARLATRWT
jgi:16S rRNA (adenine1518-N6/adenine1519-N6)-dimethyltransferase